MGATFAPPTPPLELDKRLSEDRAVGEGELAAIALLGVVDLGRRDVLEDDKTHRIPLLSERGKDGRRDVERDCHHRKSRRVGDALAVPVEHVVGFARREERRNRRLRNGIRRIRRQIDGVL
jgi:hypothetical protein